MEHDRADRQLGSIGDGGGFPPRPRSWRGLIDNVVEQLGESRCEARWEPVQLRGLSAAWIGVNCPSLGDIGRPWVWDVVTAADHEGHPELRTDPLALVVEQDVVVVALRRADHASPLVQLQVPVNQVPDQVEVPANALPTAPWRLELSTGWTSNAIGRALGQWVTGHVGGDVPVRPLHGVPAEAEEDRFSMGDRLWATSSAFDVLLEQDPHEAAAITRCLGAVAEALEPWRKSAA